MGNRRLSVTILVAGISILGADTVRARELTFEDRVKAQEAVERVYYSHQIGANKPFEEAVPREIIEKKVRTYLKQSVALDEIWHTRVTAEMLRREMERMARQTRMPERLRELYSALGNDVFRIQECLARPALVSRLTRNFFAYDRVIHAESHRAAESLRVRLVAGRIDPWSEDPHRTVLDFVRIGPLGSSRRTSEERGPLPSGPQVPSPMELGPDEFNRWLGRIPERSGEVGPLLEERDRFVIRILLRRDPDEVRVANYLVQKRRWDEWWKQIEGDLHEWSVAAVASGDQPLPIAVNGPEREWDMQGGVLPPAHGEQVATAFACIPDDTWDNGSLDDMPDPRRNHTVVWTGSLMVVWGGNGDVAYNTGGRYDPTTDTWAPTSTVNAPAPRSAHTAVWTGSLMVVWGGSLDSSGGRYDPAADIWTPTSTSDAPSGRSGHTTVWTGSLMVVWGGQANDGSSLNTGGRYNPSTDTWSPTSMANAPSIRTSHTAVWTGTRMVVWGGFSGSPDFLSLNTGGRYDPATDTWAPTTTTNAPSGRSDHVAVWTGSVMVVWGNAPSGGRYDPAADTWTTISPANAPCPFCVFQTAVWTGSVMVVWGGVFGGSSFVDEGGRYDPVTDAWTPTSKSNAPSARELHTAVWTGTLMVVWGGDEALGQVLNSGGRYDAVTDTWTPTSMTDAPTPRTFHTAVWTGSLMIVWGGRDNFTYLDTGGRYDPLTDTWTPTTTTNAPSARDVQTAAWTGDLMVVWGGLGASGRLNTGGRYDPGTDTWSPTSTTSAPPARGGHSAVWTGSLIVVWGGSDGSSLLNTGGRYDPTTDTWTPTATTNAPTPRTGHTAVWTGTLMLMWGGVDGCAGSCAYLNTGGRYDPTTDSWTPTSQIGAPVGRSNHTAVWTGTLMVVWGGFPGTFTSSGGRYDPVTDTWTPTSLTNAPSRRSDHAAVWTGSLMVIWGGDGLSDLQIGGRYDPATDTWTPTSKTNAPEIRERPTSVWAGSFMVVWGGDGGTFTIFDTGGRYASGFSVDNDGDGFSECGGDCNDGNASVYPGAPEVCDGLDNNCDGVIDNGAGPPSRTVGVALSTDTDIMWTPTLGAISYDVVKGDLRLLHMSGGDFTSSLLACLENDSPDLRSSDPALPAMGEAFYFLVRASGCNQNGTYASGSSGQVGSRDLEIEASPSSCP